MRNSQRWAGVPKESSGNDGQLRVKYHGNFVCANFTTKFITLYERKTKVSCLASLRDVVKTPLGTSWDAGLLVPSLLLFACHLSLYVSGEAPAAYVVCGGWSSVPASELQPFPHCNGYKTQAKSLNFLIAI